MKGKNEYFMCGEAMNEIYIFSLHGKAKNEIYIFWLHEMK